MRWLVLILVTLVLGFLLGPMIQKVPGTLLVVFEQYSRDYAKPGIHDPLGSN